MDFHLHSPILAIEPTAKIKKSFSNRLKIKYDVPQGSVLGTLLFNINSFDLFYECQDSDIDTVIF